MPAADEVWVLVAGPLESLRTEAIEHPDLPWPDRRENLYRELFSVVAEPMVNQLMYWLDELPEADRADLLVSDDLASHAYQVVCEAVPDEPAEVGDAGYDEQAWFAYLAENGPRWDGTDESWPGFREWFVHYATEAGLHTPAILFLDHLEPLAAADRVTMFAEYGVTIQAPEPAVAALDPLSQKVMDELLARKPHYADIPEAHRVELVTALLAREESAQ
jgi:hypothetical protein